MVPRCFHHNGARGSSPSQRDRHIFQVWLTHLKSQDPCCVCWSISAMLSAQLLGGGSVSNTYMELWTNWHPTGNKFSSHHFQIGIKHLSHVVLWIGVLQTKCYWLKYDTVPCWSTCQKRSNVWRTIFYPNSPGLFPKKKGSNTHLGPPERVKAPRDFRRVSPRGLVQSAADVNSTRGWKAKTKSIFSGSNCPKKATTSGRILSTKFYIKIKVSLAPPMSHFLKPKGFGKTKCLYRNTSQPCVQPLQPSPASRDVAIPLSSWTGKTGATPLALPGWGQQRQEVNWGNWTEHPSNQIQFMKQILMKWWIPQIVLRKWDKKNNCKFSCFALDTKALSSTLESIGQKETDFGKLQHHTCRSFFLKK